MARLTVAGGLALLALSLAAPVVAQEQQPAPRQRLTPEQRQAMVQKLEQGRQARGAAMIQRLDKNDDGTVTREEWARQPQLFDRLDANKDGVLSAAELAAAPTPGQVRMRQARALMLRARVRRMDTDRDGRISQAEWKGQPERFDKLDQNNDGFLTPEELRAAFARRGPGK